MKKVLWIIILLVLVGLFIWNRSKNDALVSSENIKIGAALALTGDAAAWGEAELNAANMAIEEINNDGGVNGQKLELVVEDIRSNSKDAISAVQKLQSVDKVKAIIISWLDVYIGAESILKPENIMISPSAGIEAVNGAIKHPRVFATWYRTQPKSELVVKYMAEKGIKTLYILTENDSYYDTVSQFTKEAATKYGVQVLGHEKLNPGADVKATLSKIAIKKPDALFVGFYDQKKLTEFLNIHKSFLGPNILVFGDEIIEQNYQNSDYPRNGFEGVYFYSPQQPNKSFFNSYVARYGTNPIFGAGPAYDTVYMLAEVFQDQPVEIDQYMRSRSFKTVSYGEVTFDELGGIKAKSNYFTIKQIRNGEAVDMLK